MGEKMDERKELFASLFDEVKHIVDGPAEMDEKLASLCRLFLERIPHYHWVGFYLVEEPGKRELVLGPFAGEPTEHVRIPFGRGICGQAAEKEKTMVVQDVSKETNYLSCSPRVRSEILIPIFKHGVIVGELDIDSHDLSPFTEEDRKFLEQVCELISGLF